MLPNKTRALELAQELVEGLSASVDPKVGSGYGVEVQWPRAEVTGSIDRTNVWVTLDLERGIVLRKQRLVELPGRVFRTDDAGATWEPASAASGTFPDSAVTDGSVERAEDGGLLPAPYEDATAMTTVADSLVQLAIGPDYVARLVDGGATWETVLDGGLLPVTLVPAPDFARSGVAVVVMWRNGVWRTQDFGASWDQVLAGNGHAMGVEFSGPLIAIASEPPFLRWEPF